MTTIRINSDLSRRSPRNRRTFRPHRLPVCAATGLARYRDRHQAKHAAAVANTSRRAVPNVFACPDCRGFHLEAIRPVPLSLLTTRPSTAGATDAEGTGRKYVLVDIENLTSAASMDPNRALEQWETIKRIAGLTDSDHIVMGAARSVARKYRPHLSGRNVRWVIGANSTDAADNALLAATNLHLVSRRFDTIVIASGDHAFADLASRARTGGLAVEVLSERSMTSRALLIEATRYLPIHVPRPATAQLLASNWSSARLAA